MYLPVMKQGPVDFVVERSGVLTRVQVKTGTWHADRAGRRYMQVRLRNHTDTKRRPLHEMYDELFVVGEDNAYWVVPARLLTTDALVVAGAVRRVNGRRAAWVDEHRVQ